MHLCVLRRAVRRPPRLLGDRLPGLHRHRRSMPPAPGFATNVTGAGYEGYGNVVVVDHGNQWEEPVRPPERGPRRPAASGSTRTTMIGTDRFQRRGEHAPSPLRGVGERPIWLGRIPRSRANEGVPGRASWSRFPQVLGLRPAGRACRGDRALVASDGTGCDVVSGVTDAIGATVATGVAAVNPVAAAGARAGGGRRLQRRRHRRRRIQEYRDRRLHPALRAVVRAARPPIRGRRGRTTSPSRPTSTATGSATSACATRAAGSSSSSTARPSPTRSPTHGRRAHSSRCWRATSTPTAWPTSACGTRPPGWSP